MKAAMGGRVSAWLFDGIAQSPEQAAEMAFRVNQARDMKKAQRMAKLGPAGFMMWGRG